MKLKESAYFPIDIAGELKVRFKAWTKQHMLAKSELRGWESLLEDLNTETDFDSLASLNIILERCWTAFHSTSTQFQGMLTKNILSKLKLGKSAKVVGFDLEDSRAPDVEAVSLPWKNDQGIWFDFKVNIKGNSTIQISSRKSMDEEVGFRLTRYKNEPMERRMAVLLLAHVLTVLVAIRWFLDYDMIDALLTYFGCVLMGIPLVLMSLKFANKFGANRRMVDRKEFVTYSARKGRLQSYVSLILSHVDSVIELVLGRILFVFRIGNVNGIFRVNIPPEPSDRVWVGFALPPDYDLRVEFIFVTKSRFVLLDNIPIVRLVTAIISKLCVKKLREKLILNFVLPNIRDFRLNFLDPFPSEDMVSVWAAEKTE